MSGLWSNHYRTNWFRLLELPVLATDRDVKRRVRILQTAAEIGIPVQEGPQRVMTLEVDITNQLGVVHELQDPEVRVLHMALWFWNQDTGMDTALAQLLAGNLDEALKLWTLASQRSPVAAHNAIVLRYLIALESGENGCGQESTWIGVLTGWSEHLASPGFWAQLRHFGAHVRDPRVNEEFWDRIRCSIPAELAKTHAELAAAAATKGDAKTLILQCKLLISHCPRGGGSDTIHQDLALCLIRFARQKLARFEVEASRDGIPAESLVREFLPVMEALQVLMPQGHAEVISMGNDMAAAACQLAQYNSMDLERRIRLLESVMPWADSKSVRIRIEQDLGSYHGRLWLNKMVELVRTSEQDEGDPVERLERLIREGSSLLASSLLASSPDNHSHITARKVFQAALERVIVALTKEGNMAQVARAREVVRSLGEIGTHDESTPVKFVTAAPSPQPPENPQPMASALLLDLTYKQQRAAEAIAASLWDAYLSVKQGAKYLPVFFQVGSTSSVGDALGPFVGWYLKRRNFHGLFLGTLDRPVDANNIKEAVNEAWSIAMSRNKFPWIVAVGAAVGRPGRITVKTGPLKPGAGVGKQLPSVGSVHIMGGTSVAANLMDSAPLDLVVRIAEVVAAGLMKFHQKLEE